jgi:predicted ABC-type ATPase
LRVNSIKAKRRRRKAPRCIIVAGPNGAGKTTFAEEFLPSYAKVVHFVNADLIARGLSPLCPELAAIRAGRLLLNEIDRLAGGGADFAFESTLSGIGYVSRLQQWKTRGYRIEIIYLTLPTVEIALRRIREPGSTGRARYSGNGLAASF